MLNNKNWFYRPHFLQDFEFNILDKCSVLQNKLMNIKDVNIITKSKYDGSNNEIEINWTYYSSLPKLIPHINWILRLKLNWTIWKRGEKGRENLTQLSTKDTYNGLETLIKIAHHQSFSLEITFYHKEVSTATAKFYHCLLLLIRKYLTCWRKIEKC